MATLSQYLLLLRNLIQSPTAPVPLLPDALLTEYVNIARNQVALDGECVRHFGVTTIGTGVVGIPIADVLDPAVGFAMVVRNAWVGGVRADIRPWDWFVVYSYGQSPGNYPVMSHQGSGVATTLYISSRAGGQLLTDVVALPLFLVDDTTFDHVSYPWSEAVAFYAAWYAYMNMQRQADAEVFLGRYREVMRRAMAETTSTALPNNDPGGLGAMVATTKVPLGQSPAQPAAQRGR